MWSLTSDDVTDEERFKQFVSDPDYDRRITEAIRAAMEEAKKPRRKKKEPGEEQVIYTSEHETQDYIYEQVHDKTSRFARYDKNLKDVTYVDSIQVDDVIYKPLMGEEITKGAILLPTKAEPYGDDDKLDADIKYFIHKWLDIPPEYLQFSIWNIKRSWVYQKFHSLNYLRVMGDTGQGKSRFLDTIGSLHYKPIFASGAATAAPIFRIIDKWQGTLVIDEADIKITDETAEIIKIINQGYERGKFVLRCDQNDANKLNCFDPFCPKVLATRKPFEDKAVESRCITHVMTGTTRRDIIFTLTPTFFEEARVLRNKLLMWRFHNYGQIAQESLTIDDWGELEPRIQQVVSSYIAMFGHNSDQMVKFKEFMKEYQSELIEERATSWAGQIVTAIYELIESGCTEISAQDIINKGDLTDTRGRLMHPRALNNVLKELGFGKTESRKIDGKTKRCIPLDDKHLSIIFKRYGYDTTKVTVGTGGSHSTPLCVDDAKIEDFSLDVTIGGALPYKRNHRNSVTEECDLGKCRKLIIGVLKRSEENQVGIDLLAANLKMMDYTDGQIDDVISVMKKEGEIYEPHRGVIKLI